MYMFLRGATVSSSSSCERLKIIMEGKGRGCAAKLANVGKSSHAAECLGSMRCPIVDRRELGPLPRDRYFSAKESSLPPQGRAQGPFRGCLAPGESRAEKKMIEKVSDAFDPERQQHK
jgi:hypothetical protein